MFKLCNMWTAGDICVAESVSTCSMVFLKKICQSFNQVNVKGIVSVNCRLDGNWTGWL